MKTTNYTLLEGKADHYFAEQVKRYIARGWQPLGPPFYYRRPDYLREETYIAQTMVVCENVKARARSKK